MHLTFKQSGSFLSSKFPLIRMTLFIPKSEFKDGTTIQVLDYFINNPEKRLQWDVTLKEYKNVEATDIFSILYSLMKKPNMFISQRDIIDKKVDFYANNRYYSFSTSTPDEFMPVTKEAERAIDYISGYSMYEDEKNFYFRSISQVDLKLPSVTSVMKSTLPPKLKEWYNNLKKAINE